MKNYSVDFICDRYQALPICTGKSYSTVKMCSAKCNKISCLRNVKTGFTDMKRKLTEK